LSNWDAFALRVADSTPTAFDLSAPIVSVLAAGNPAASGITDQGGDRRFRNRFALAGRAAPYDGAAAMRMSLAHQNPLRGIRLPRSQSGPLTAPVAGFADVDAANVVITALKPVEEGARGILVRVWELAGERTAFVLDLAAFAPTAAFTTTLVETDIGAVTLSDGRILDTIDANQMRAYRVAFTPGAPLPSPTPTRTVAPGRCAGDCDGNGAATIDELVLGVGIALGSTDLAACGILDLDADETVRVDELVGAVAAALSGC
jgi:hypothetical protein